MTHDELKALLPLAALERMEPDEVASLREHLAGCAECDAELREFEHVLSMLALALDAPATEERVTRKLEARLAGAAGTHSGAERTLYDDRRANAASYSRFLNAACGCACGTCSLPSETLKPEPGAPGCR